MPGAQKCEETDVVAPDRQEPQKGLDFMWTPSVPQWCYPEEYRLVMLLREAWTGFPLTQTINLSVLRCWQTWTIQSLSSGLRVYKLLTGETTHCFLRNDTADWRGVSDSGEAETCSRSYCASHHELQHIHGRQSPTSGYRGRLCFSASGLSPELNCGT